MSQLDFIQTTVSDFFDALVDSDLADVGFYCVPPIAPPFADEDGRQIRVLIRRDVAEAGSYGHVPGQKQEVRIVNADLPNSQKRDGIVKVTSLAAGEEYFKLVSKVSDNGAISTWSAVRVS